MADKSGQLVLEALSRVAAEPTGLPVFSGKNLPGLFPSSAAGKQAAGLCREQGFLRSVRTEPRGKAMQEICAISEAGLTFLLEQASPREVLQALVQALDGRRTQIEELVVSARTNQQDLADLAKLARQVLERCEQPANASVAASNGHAHDERSGPLLTALRAWHESGTLGDCPLPRLYRSAAGGSTIGQFHDVLRALHRERKIYLHPWTGPLYEIPEPALALLIGHEIAYYASLCARPGG